LEIFSIADFTINSVKVQLQLGLLISVPEITLHIEKMYMYMNWLKNYYII